MLLAILFIVASENAFCQLNPFRDEDAMVTPNFREDIIKGKWISQITIRYFSKPDGFPITDEGIIHQYFFDTLGKLTESFYITKISRHSGDTIKYRYWYDANGALSSKRVQTGDFYDTWYYKWNKDTMLQNEYHTQETSDAGDTFKVATQRMISADSFAYIIYPKQTQQYTYNEDHKIFRKTIIQYDDNKRFVSRNCQYAIGSLYSQVDISYDSLGRINGYLNTGNLNGDVHTKTSIKYDSTGKMAEQNMWEHDKQTHHIEYMYDNATGLISNKLDKDMDKATIFILRFSYEVYDDNNPSVGVK